MQNSATHHNTAYMRQTLATLAIALVATAALADVPAGYYSNLDGKSDEALKTAIHDIISQHTQLTYSSLWDYFPSTDVYPETVDGKTIVWDMYSDNWTNQTYYYPGHTSGLNREHSVPKSWWGSGSSTSAIEQYMAGTDLMHLFPSDGSANSAKSNYPLGVVAEATFDNGVAKVGYAETGQGGGCSYVFEPDDEYKGDFARVYFYMATCYQDYTWKYQYMFLNTSSSYLSLKPWAYNLLLEWHREDPVSDKEIDRNEVVYSIQGNRNPFVDDPDLVEFIWGTRKGETYTADHTTGTPTLVSPVQDSELNFGEVALGSSAYVDLYVKGESLTQALTVTIYKNDASMFSAASSSIAYYSANSSSGYKLRVTYTPTGIGDHTSRLVLSDGGLTGSVGVALAGTCLEVPTLSQLTAYEATNIADTCYRASWSEATETIDYYLLTRTVYDGSSYETTEYEVNDTYLDFTDLQPGQTHTYYVQSSRLGYLSDASNTITVAQSGVTGVTVDTGLAIVSYSGGVIRFITSEPHTGCRVYDLQGRLVKSISTINDNDFVELPLGVYLITTDRHKQPVKVIAKP